MTPSRPESPAGSAGTQPPTAGSVPVHDGLPAKRWPSRHIDSARRWHWPANSRALRSAFSSASAAVPMRWWSMRTSLVHGTPAIAAADTALLSWWKPAHHSGMRASRPDSTARTGP